MPQLKVLKNPECMNGLNIEEFTKFETAINLFLRVLNYAKNHSFLFDTFGIFLC